MARPYPCVVTVHWRPATGLPPLVLQYYVQAASRKFTRRLAIQLPQAAPSGGGKKVVSAAVRRQMKGGMVLGEDDCTRNGWFLWNAEGWAWRAANEA